MKNYKYMCAAVMVCVTLVNIQTYKQTHRQHFDQLIQVVQPAELKMHKKYS